MPMGDSFSKFNYLEPVINRCPAFRFTDDYINYVEHIPQGDLEMLTLAYKQIEKNQDAVPLSAWIQNNRLNDPFTATRFFHLFLIFDLLADKGFLPFASRRVEFLLPLPSLNWDKLPTELKFLIGPAERYGPVRSTEQNERFVSQLSSEQQEELRNTSAQLRNAALTKIFFDWIEAHPELNHAESDLLVNLKAVMDLAGYPIEPELNDDQIREAWKIAQAFQTPCPEDSTFPTCPACRKDLPNPAVAHCPNCGFSWEEATL
jgi:hypothetical protein